MGYSATVVCDSVTETEDRLTTIEATYPRFVHAEALTHRQFSRNASSNRALPVKKIISQIINDPVVPVWWGKTQRGMVADVEMTGWRRWLCTQIWLKARYLAILVALLLYWLGLHRQLVSRLLEPWQWITVIFTATEWANFFKLRCHKDAQPEIQVIARMMRDAMQASVPVKRRWHLPYVTEGELQCLPLDTCIKLSVARCARVSYLGLDGKYRPDADLKLYDRLVKGDPEHASPKEHVAMAAAWPDEVAYNLCAWQSWRYIQDNDYLDITSDELQEKAA